MISDRFKFIALTFFFSLMAAVAALYAVQGFVYFRSDKRSSLDVFRELRARPELEEEFQRLKQIEQRWGY